LLVPLVVLLSPRSPLSLSVAAAVAAAVAHERAPQPGAAGFWCPRWVALFPLREVAPAQGMFGYLNGSNGDMPRSKTIVLVEHLASADVVHSSGERWIRCSSLVDIPHNCCGFSSDVRCHISYLQHGTQLLLAAPPLKFL